MRVLCVLDNGKSVKRQRAMVMLWSFYPHLDWTKSLNATDSTVDHITGTHENEHFGTLECVPNKENIKRAVLHDKSAAQKSGSSRSKPFNVYKNGVLCFECKNTLDAKAKFKEHENIDCMKILSPGYYIKNNKTYKKIYTFQYIEREPELLEGEEWRPESQWCQKDELLKLAKTPTEISSKGRIKDACGIISRGKDDYKHSKTRYYSGINVAKVVHYAFSNRVLKKDDIILHNDGVIMTDGVMLNDGSGRYSNALGTFRIGNHKQNMEDMSETHKREASLEPANEFIVKKDGQEIGNYFYIPNCAEELVKAYGGKKSSYQSGIFRCLKGERPYLSKKLNLVCAYKIQRLQKK